jgi:hypothetical protein
MHIKMKDYYKILEVAQSATNDELKKSYRRLALKYHPDRNSGDKLAEANFKEVVEAYEVLSNIEERKKYDINYTKSHKSSANNGSQQKTRPEYSKQEDPQTPMSFLSVVIELKRKIAGFEKKRINQRILFDSINEILTDNNIKFLLFWNDTKINRQIIAEILDCCKPLGYDIHPIKGFIYIEQLSSKLVTLAGTDNETIQNIVSYIKQRKLFSYWDRYKGIAAIAAIILLFLIPTYFGNNSSSSYDRPQSVNLYYENNTESSNSPSSRVYSNKSSSQSSDALSNPLKGYTFEKFNYIDFETGREVNPDEKLFRLYVSMKGDKEYTKSYNQFKKRYAHEKGMLELFSIQTKKGKYTKDFNDFKQEYSFMPIEQDYTLANSHSQKATNFRQSRTVIQEDLAGWEKFNYSTGNTPNCFNFSPRYDYSLDNQLQVIVSANTDVVLKLINYNTGKCIRYVYIRSGTTFSIRNIPEGKYYTKIAYGRDWRQKVINGQCVGKFVHNALYKKGEDILDFNRVFEGVIIEGEYEYTNYSIPSFSLSLDVTATDFDTNKYNTNAISEDEFNN